MVKIFYFSDGLKALAFSPANHRGQFLLTENLDYKSAKVIKGYNNYLVTKCGNVISLYNNQYLKHSINSKGYSVVTLYEAGQRKNFLVHRLVADAFITNPSNFKTVDHIDGDKQNNQLENLQWLSIEKNLTKSSCYASKYGYKPRLKSPDNLVYEVENIRMFARTHNLPLYRLQQVIAQKSHQTKGWSLTDS